MLRYEMKKAGDIVELNREVASFMSDLFVGMKGTIVKTYTCESDYRECSHERGIDLANQCCCHYRAEVKLNDFPNVYIKDLVFSELNIVDLYGNDALAELFD